MLKASYLPPLNKESELYQDGENKEHNSLHCHAHQVTSSEHPFKWISNLFVFTYKQTTTLLPQQTDRDSQLEPDEHENIGGRLTDEPDEFQTYTL